MDAHRRLGQIQEFTRLREMLKLSKGDERPDPIDLHRCTSITKRNHRYSYYSFLL
ncbi:hypothetical protein Q0N33_06975 [Rossellomorea marisflavi]